MAFARGRVSVLTRQTMAPWLAILALVAGFCGAAPAFAVDRVLPPHAGPLVEQAFARAAPRFRLAGARLQADRVSAEVCTGTTCWALELRDPARGCRDDLAGPWCVRFAGHRPPDAAVLLQALAIDNDRSVWVVPDLPEERPAALPATATLTATPAWAQPDPMRPRRTQDRAFPWQVVTTAGLTLVGPWVLGLGLARIATRRRRLQGRMWLLILFLVPLAVAVSVGLSTMSVGLWDLAWSALLLGLGGVLGGHEAGREPGRWLLAAVTTIAGALVLEATVRMLLPEPPSFPAPAEAALFLPPRTLAAAQARLHGQSSTAACLMLFPAAGHAVVAHRWASAGERPRRFVHLGDSMTFGSGVDEVDRFTERLAAADPGTAHVNLGMPGTSIDAQLLAARLALQRGPVHAVILHIFAGNDLVEVDHPYPCCDGPLWTRSEPPQPRCQTWTQSADAGLPGWYLANSPPPYALRVATAFSHAARAVCALHVRWATGADQALPQMHAVARYVRLLGVLQADLRARGVPLLISWLPIRGRGARTPLAGEGALRSALQSAGFEVLNPSAEVTHALAAGGDEAVFLPGDSHLNPAGHALMARFLASRLPRSPVGSDRSPGSRQ